MKADAVSCDQTCIQVKASCSYPIIYLDEYKAGFSKHRKEKQS